MFIDRMLMALVGCVFVIGGAWIAKSSLDSKNLMESALFGLLGLGTGIFLIVCSVCGPPD